MNTGIRLTSIIFILALILFVFIADPNYYYFLNDDFIHIPLAAQRNFIRGSLIRPLSDLTLWLDYILWKKDAYGYHLTNSLLHIINAALVFFTCRYLFQYFDKDGRDTVLDKSFLAATLFLVYAYHSESIFWIIGRGASLCTLFFFLALIFYFKSFIRKGAYILSLLSFFIGLLAYETIWVFPMILLVLHFFVFKKKGLFRLCGVWLLFFVYLLIRLHFASSYFGEYELRSIIHLDFYRLFYNTNTLLARCFLPPLENSINFVIFYIVLMLILTYVFFKNAKERILKFAAFCLLISLVPVIAIGIDTHDTESERFIYLASFFAVFFLIQLISKLNYSFRMPVFIIFLSMHSILLYFAAQSYKASSHIAKLSLNCIPNDTHFKTIYAVELPTQYKGALIFRTGFPQAISWIRNVTYDSVRIVSFKETIVNNPIYCSDIKVNQLDAFNRKQMNGILDQYNIHTRFDDMVLFWNNEHLEIINHNIDRIGRFK